MNAGVVCGVILVVLVTFTEGQSVCNGNPELACSVTSPCMYAGEECVNGCCAEVATTTTPSGSSSTCSDPEFSCYDSAGTYQCYEGETCDTTGCCVDVTTPAP
ncbi:uncharacterized protein LOC111104701 [Crassostrea virginica]